MSRTMLYMPEDPEGLIVETAKLLTDARVAEVVVSRVPEGAERREEESDAEFAKRAWRFLIPASNSDYHRVRCLYGWTRREAQQVMALIDAVALYMKGQQEVEGILSGTAETLKRDRDRLVPLWQWWDRVQHA
jgi:hypothetical protein